jgi:PRTRC genetic system protein B
MKRMKMKKSVSIEKKPQSKELVWTVPKELGIPSDSLRLRLDFFHQAIEMTIFEGDVVESRIVSALDIAHSLSETLHFGTGLLPANTLWWENTKAGVITAIYDPPRIRDLALQLEAGKPPDRYKVPMPGMIFLCTPGKPPWVFAVTKQPTKETDQVFKAPLLNVFENGRTCGGSNRYPERVGDIIENFYMCFFSHDGHFEHRSKKYPKDVTSLWKFLNGKKEFPADDLEPHGQVMDLMRMLKE